VTRRAAERRVVTASKCGIYCFNSYLIPFRNRAVIMRRHFLWLLETDEEGFFAGHFLMHFNAAVINYYLA